MNCSGCGSRLSDDAMLCDLCGTPVDGDEHGTLDFDQQTPEEQEVGSAGIVAPASSADKGMFCNECGWKNPPASRYCSQCGSVIQAGEEAPVPVAKPKKKKQASRTPVAESETMVTSSSGVEPGAGKRMGILIGAAVLIVVAVYMIFNVGGQNGTQVVASQPGVPIEPPLAAEFASREAELRQEMSALDGEARVDKQRELLTLYFTSGRLDLAGAQAEQIGLATGSETAWIDAGNFYYDWMDSSAPEFRAFYSRKATAAYRKALELNPDNLDVRTDMAVAYLYDPEQSMLAIQETAAVLEADSNHVQANFNKGIMLMQINRVPEAVEQFEKVMQLAPDPENILYQRANELLVSLR